MIQHRRPRKTLGAVAPATRKKADARFLADKRQNRPATPRFSALAGRGESEMCVKIRFMYKVTLRCCFIAIGLGVPAVLVAQAAPDLKSVHKIYIDKLPNDLDQYLRAEFSKQMKGKIVVVLDEKDSDAILTGVSEEEKGTGAKITGRYLGLHDIATASLSLVDKDRKVILWSDEAGDRSLMFSVMRRGGERKVAERLVEKLKKATGH
jgi:hypothetical protein